MLEALWNILNITAIGGAVGESMDKDLFQCINNKRRKLYGEPGWKSGFQRKREVVALPELPLSNITVTIVFKEILS